MMLRVHRDEAEGAAQRERPEVGMTDAGQRRAPDVAREAIGGATQARLQVGLRDAGAVGAYLARGARADGEGAVEEHVGEEDPAEERLLHRAEDALHLRLAGELAREDLVRE